MPQVIFITATDTGAGKTVAAAALSRWLARSGQRVKYCKPFQTGPARDWDAPFVAAHGACATIVDRPFWHHDHPGAPYECVRFFDAPAPCLDALDAWMRRHVLGASEDCVLVEGCGGLYVPLTRSFYVADMIARYPAMRVAQVSSLKLGTINHSLLSIRALSNAANPIAGHIFCGEGNDRNMPMIASLTDLPVLGRVFFPADGFFSASAPEALSLTLPGRYDCGTDLTYDDAYRH